MNNKEMEIEFNFFTEKDEQRMYNFATLAAPITREDMKFTLTQLKIINAITDLQEACVECPKNPTNGGDGNCNKCVLGKPIAKKAEEKP